MVIHRGYRKMKSLTDKTITLHETTQGEINLSPRLITLIKPVPLGSAPFEYGAKTFISYGRDNMNVTHYYVAEEIAEMMV